MTITVSIEELREYERQCLAWTAQRGAAIEALFLSLSREGGMFQERRLRSNFTDELQKWDKANPFPRLIPTV